MQSLDDRKRTILRAVVLEYVQEGEPVASELIVRKYELGVRSATIRSELAEMSDLGFLEQPHTSAGRIPSDIGFRYYVDHLGSTKNPTEGDQRRVRNSTTQSDVLTQILRESTKVLSRMTQQVAAATTVKNLQVQLSRAVITALSTEKAMLILVFSNGDVENRILECPMGLSLEDFGQLNEQFLSELSGQRLVTLKRLKSPCSGGKSPFERFVASICSTIRTVAKDMSQAKVIVEGEEYLFAKPELLSGPLLSLLESEEELGQALESPGTEPLTISIGRENTVANAQELTIMRHSFLVNNDEAGIIAIIGSKRLDYDATIGLLQFASHAIGETLTKLTIKA